MLAVKRDEEWRTRKWRGRGWRTRVFNTGNLGNFQTLYSKSCGYQKSHIKNISIWGHISTVLREIILTRILMIYIHIYLSPTHQDMQTKYIEPFINAISMKLLLFVLLCFFSNCLCPPTHGHREGLLALRQKARWEVGSYVRFSQPHRKSWVVTRRSKSQIFLLCSSS